MKEVHRCFECSTPLLDKLGRERLVESDPNMRFCPHGRLVTCWDCEKAWPGGVRDDHLCPACQAGYRILQAVTDELRAIEQARRAPKVYQGRRRKSA